MAYKIFWNNCDITKLEIKLKNTKNIKILKKIQCIYLRAKEGLGAQEIGKIVSLSESTVKKIQNRFRKEDEKIFEIPNHGGRRNENMNSETEKNFLKI